jgi:hypothetical protein
MKRTEPVIVKSIPNGAIVPCAALMYRKKVRRHKGFSGACPNMADVLVQGTPYCSAHAPQASSK